MGWLFEPWYMPNKAWSTLNFTTWICSLARLLNFDFDQNFTQIYPEIQKSDLKYFLSKNDKILARSSFYRIFWQATENYYSCTTWMRQKVEVNSPSSTQCSTPPPFSYSCIPIWVYFCLGWDILCLLLFQQHNVELDLIYGLNFLLHLRHIFLWKCWKSTRCVRPTGSN